MKKENTRFDEGLAGYRDMSTSLGEEQISKEPEQYSKPITYRVRDKKRPILGAIVTALAVGTAIAFAAGYMGWAVEESRSLEQRQNERALDTNLLNEKGGLEK